MAARADSRSAGRLSAASRVRLWEVKMKALIRKALPGLITALVMAAIGAAIDMRIALAQLQSESSDIKSRVERIERMVDSNTRFSMMEAGDGE